MISITEKELKLTASQHGYRPEILEKVYRLLDLIDVFMNMPFLRRTLVLKGGTAINLFCTDQLPRLSLDIDFNYIGSTDRETMLSDKNKIDRLISDICLTQQYAIIRNPKAHAGGKAVIEYASLLGTKGRIELDINYLYRSPLWKPTFNYSADWPRSVGVNLLDIHELAAGKLHALLDRDAGRDLFDSHRLLNFWPLDFKKLRLAFTVYAGMRAKGWRSLSINNITMNVKDIRNKLIPVLKKDLIPGTTFNEIKPWAKIMVEESVNAFEKLLPFNNKEIQFLTSLEEDLKIKPELLSDDETFCNATRNHSALLWRIKKNKD